MDDPRLYEYDEGHRFGRFHNMRPLTIPEVVAWLREQGAVDLVRSNHLGGVDFVFDQERDYLIVAIDAALSSTGKVTT